MQNADVAAVGVDASVSGCARERLALVDIVTAVHVDVEQEASSADTLVAIGAARVLDALLFAEALITSTALDLFARVSVGQQFVTVTARAEVRAFGVGALVLAASVAVETFIDIDAAGAVHRTVDSGRDFARAKATTESQMACDFLSRAI